MLTKDQFEKTYMHKEAVMTYDKYVEMESHTSNFFKKYTTEEISKGFAEDAEYNNARGWTND